MTEPRSRAAALLDRDGTIIHDRIYTRDPDTVELLPGAASAIRRLAAAGFPSIVVTNQSGIARGIISLAQYHAVRRRLAELLAAEGATLLDTFACPHAPELHGDCGCRKPATGLFERAANVYDLDLSRCLYIGDRARDVSPAKVFGGRSALVVSGTTTEDDLVQSGAMNTPIVPSLAEAVSLLLAPTS
jgi:histidinol-phosphate phosphatase family protein